MSKIKVVLADDKPSIVEGLTALIDWKGLGFEIAGTALDGEDAFALVSSTRPDVLITDIRMPVFDGLELAGLIREQGWDTRIIILTGYQDFEYARAALRHGVIDFLLKPLDEVYLSRLLATLAREIEQEKLSALGPVVLPEVDDHDVVGRVMKVIRERYRENLTVKGIADELYISAPYLGQVYIKRTGTTILSSVHSVRVEAAKHLLTTTTLRIFEVAAAVGFADEEYFSKRFQAITGKTPGVWRKESSRKNQ